MEVYADRLAALNFEGRLGDIDIGIQEAKAEFQRLIQLGLDELHARRRLLLERERDLMVFKEDNKLRRAAHFPNTPVKVLLIGLIFVLGMIETFGNTYFLAKGNELGIFGAYTEATIISALNLVGAMIFAHWCQNVVHANVMRRMVGYLAVLGYIAFMFGLNLLVAHYREVSGVFLENGGVEAIKRIRANPLGLQEFQSWTLLGMGCLFSIISFWDKLHLDDVYPGYGKRTRVLSADREEYIAEKEHHNQALGDHLNRAVDTLRATRHDLIRWRQDHTSMLESRGRIIEAFDAQMVHLERAGNSLLTVYRETNRKARGGKAPKRFKDPWEFTLPNVDRKLPATALDSETMDRLITQSDGKLAAGVTALHEEHNSGLQRYRALDDLVADEQTVEAPNGEAT